jgi:outer membrane protein assembly factor BamE (lipoprotein component of BamABCDE complex)
LQLRDRGQPVAEHHIKARCRPQAQVIAKRHAARYVNRGTIATDMGMQGGIGNPRTNGTPRWAAAGLLAAVIALALPLAGCFSETYHKGYVIPEGALEQIPIGASQDQVLILMGTPSTVATVSGEVFYYISQRAERPVAFMPQAVTDQRVIAVYFDRNRRVERLANYGLKDGKIFDYISRTTPTGGEELSVLGQVFKIMPW